MCQVSGKWLIFHFVFSFLFYSPFTSIPGSRSILLVWTWNFLKAWAGLGVSAIHGWQTCRVSHQRGRFFRWFLFEFFFRFFLGLFWFHRCANRVFPLTTFDFIGFLDWWRIGYIFYRFFWVFSDFRYFWYIFRNYVFDWVFASSLRSCLNRFFESRASSRSVCVCLQRGGCTSWFLLLLRIL